jgi:hypothetical protein
MVGSIFSYVPIGHHVDALPPLYHNPVRLLFVLLNELHTIGGGGGRRKARDFYVEINSEPARANEL